MVYTLRVVVRGGDKDDAFDFRGVDETQKIQVLMEAVQSKYNLATPPRLWIANAANADHLKAQRIIKDCVNDGVLIEYEGEEKSILNGLPELGPRCATKSLTSIPSDHEPITAIVKSLVLSSSLHLSKTPSVTWILAGDGGNTWSTEASIVERVKNVLADCIRAIGLEKELSAQPEVTVHALRPDLLILLHGLHPIGVIEIKTPDHEVLDSKRVHGQIFDYMLRLKTYFGLRTVFGIVSTYKQWRVFWNEEADELANSDTSLVERHMGSEVETSEADDDGDEDEDEDEFEVDISAITIDRKDQRVSCSKIYEWDNPTLPKLLCSVIVKMYASQTSAVQIGDSTRDLGCFNKTQTYWIRSPFNNPNFKLHFNKMPIASAETFIMLKDLGFGAEGRVWLVCSTTGRVGTLKFRHTSEKDQNKQEVEDEFTNWQEISGMGRIVQAGGKDGLLMPYARPVSIPSQSYSKEDAIAAVKNEVRRVATKGFIHEDLCAKHTGVVSPAKKGGAPRGLLIDLSRVKKHDGNVEEAITSMLGKLKFDD